MKGWRAAILDIQNPDVSLVASAHAAVTHEARFAARPWLGEVRAVTPLPDSEGLWRVDVEGEAPFEDGGRWEGSLLARTDADADDPGGGAERFRSTILQVDADEGCLYVEGDPLTPPVVGRCRVVGLTFLAGLIKLLGPDAPRVLLQALAGRLALAEGQRTGRALGPHPGLPPSWAHSWSLLWGPPGTGKTTTIAETVRALLDDPDERVLVVSTTNRAVDDVALQIATRRQAAGRPVTDIRRLGTVLDSAPFRLAGLDDVLPIRDPVFAEVVARAEQAVRDAPTPSARTHAQRNVRQLRARVPSLRTHALRSEVRCAVTTLHAGVGALRDDAVRSMLETGYTPFTTVVVDEAGLVSRAHAAAVSLWAALRVVLAGDPRQLSPIVTAARTMPRDVVCWLARSPLDHLSDDGLLPHVQRLTVQHRMHPEIRAAVSSFAYGGALTDGDEVSRRGWRGAGTLARLPRATWYVLDEHNPHRPAEVASRRGPRGRSRERPLGVEVLQALLDAQPELRGMAVLFVAPYRAQCDAVNRWARAQGLSTWRASTVHAQQGAQADVVIVDTVHASSSAWPAHEWKRLVNVGMSRARELMIFLCSRAEMAQPWLTPLSRSLTPRVLRARGDTRAWVTLPRTGRAIGPEADLFAPVSAAAVAAAGDVRWDGRVSSSVGVGSTTASTTRRGVSEEVPVAPPRDDARLGAQIARRRALRPLLTHEQARLVNRDLHDAGPRLVRGVAGSGKTLVLVHWAVRALRGLGIPKVSIVFGNQALGPMIQALLARTWDEVTGEPGGLPWDRVEFAHLGEVLGQLLREADLAPPGRDGDNDVYDYEHQAQRLLDAGVAEMQDGRFDALFVDEAQDFGHAPLALLVGLTRPGAEGRRAVMLFHDNAQNVYGRGTPRWADLGLDVRGRSDVMRESYRSTQPCIELALDVLDRLQPLRDDADFRELMRPTRADEAPLLTVEGEGASRRWRATFCESDGEQPEIRVFDERSAEVEHVASTVRTLVRDEGVEPSDIVVLAMRPELRNRLAMALRGVLGGVPVEVRTSEGFVGTRGVVVSTPHSFKGHDAEVVVVAAADAFVGGGRLLATPLWVALTRARTRMWVTATREADATAVPRRILAALDEVRATRALQA